MPETAAFIAELAASLDDGSFVKLTLSNYKGAEEHLQKVLARLIETRRGRRLEILTRYETRDEAKNFEPSAGVGIIREMLEAGFRSGNLFTLNKNVELKIGKRASARLHMLPPTSHAPATLDHDRVKHSDIDQQAGYLHALGITTSLGEIRTKQYGKWRQINKFVEILAGLVEKSELRGRDSLEMVDMGSGKGYLTFAAYDYFRNRKNIEIRVTGVEQRQELVDLCNGIAMASGFDGLNFVPGSIGSTDVGRPDILVALHACDTATDDAIFAGIRAQAALIVTAPCCQQELRPQMTPPEIFAGILKHGTMLEQAAEMLTDGLRSMLLEHSGYEAKIFEFVPIEHTPKNNMLVGTRNERSGERRELDKEIRELMTLFGIKEQRLARLLGLVP